MSSIIFTLFLECPLHHRWLYFYKSVLVRLVCSTVMLCYITFSKCSYKLITCFFCVNWCGRYINLDDYLVMVQQLIHLLVSWRHVSCQCAKGLGESQLPQCVNLIAAGAFSAFDLTDCLCLVSSPVVCLGVPWCGCWLHCFPTRESSPQIHLGTCPSAEKQERIINISST